VEYLSRKEDIEPVKKIVPIEETKGEEPPKQEEPKEVPVKSKPSDLPEFVTEIQSLKEETSIE